MTALKTLLDGLCLASFGVALFTAFAMISSSYGWIIAAILFIAGVLILKKIRDKNKSRDYRFWALGLLVSLIIACVYITSSDLIQGRMHIVFSATLITGVLIAMWVNGYGGLDFDLDPPGSTHANGGTSTPNPFMSSKSPYDDFYEKVRARDAENHKIRSLEADIAHDRLINGDDVSFDRQRKEDELRDLTGW